MRHPVGFLICFATLPLWVVACSDPSDTCEGCLIGEVCFPEGVSNPENPCQACVSQTSTIAWADRDGASCDDGLFCNGADTCEAGACAIHAGNPCGGGLFCDEDERQCDMDCGGCLIEGVCLFDGELSPFNSCEVCDASAVSTAFTPLDGTSCDDGVSCNGFDTCADGVCAVHNGNPCIVAEECWEEGGGRCCTQEELVLACDLNGSVVRLDSCGREFDTVEDCVAIGLDCFNGSCVCDPVGQNCPDPAEACYLNVGTETTSCVFIPAAAAGLVQGDDCYDNAGVCFLNGCAKGYGANLPDGTCAFFCNPIENSLGNIQGLTGDPAGIRCDSQFGGVRPSGPGSAYECRFLQTFYDDTGLVPATIGLCVDPASAAGGGSCADFDLPQLQQDVTDGITIDGAYCTSHPERCMWGCISLTTKNAMPILP